MVRQIVFVALLVTERPLVAQPPERKLADAQVLATAFSEITAVRELSDGRVLLLDGRDQVLSLVDIANSTLRTIGRKGGGPGEYARATGLLHAGGDTTLVTDAGNGRLLIVAPDGSFPGVITRSGTSTMSVWAATASDRKGSVFGTAGLGAPETLSERGPDSLALMQLVLSTGLAVRVATVAAPPSSVNVTRNGQTIERVEIVRAPFAVGDQFSVAPDGRIAIARRDPYRLDLVLPSGQRMSGAVVKVTRIAVGDAERAEYLASLTNARARAATIQWPDALPAFPARAVLALANGETWVRRHAPARSASAWYDIFDRRGELSARLPLSRNRRVLAATARGTYVALTDDDGLEHLELYRSLRDSPR